MSLLDQVGTASTVQFRFMLVTDYIETRQGVAIDDFFVGSFSSPKNLDFETVFVGFNNKHSAQCSTPQLAIMIQNNSVNSIVNYTVNYQVDNGPIISETPSSSRVFPIDNLYYEFIQQPTSGGTIKAWVDLNNDTDRSNDTLSTMNIVNPVPDDIEVSSINTPNASIGCGENSDSVRIGLRNYSANFQTNFPVKYQLNNGPIVSDTVKQIVPPFCTSSSSVNFTFSTPVTFTQSGLNTLRVWSELSNDGDRSNDTATQTIA